MRTFSDNPILSFDGKALTRLCRLIPAIAIIALFLNWSPDAGTTPLEADVVPPYGVGANPSPVPGADASSVSGAVGHWSFDEGSGSTAQDSSGNSNTGTLQNSPLWVPGRVGTALQFDSSQQQTVRVADSPELNFGSSSFSIAFWIRYTGGSDADILRKGSTHTADDWYKVEVKGSDHTLRFNLNTSQVSSTTLDAPGATADGHWHHVVAVRDLAADQMRFYIDGTLWASRDNPSGSIANTADLSIGSKDTLDDDFLDGSLDEVMLFPRALSDPEIQALFAAEPTPEEPSGNGALIFRSGFEPDSTGQGGSSLTGITGVDHSVGAPNNWSADLTGHPDISGFSFSYVCGDSQDRYARLVDDPTGAVNPATGATNRVMQFWLKETQRCSADTRVSTSMSTDKKLEEGFSRVRMYLHPDLLLLAQSPNATDWVQFQEIWIRPNWTGEPDPFRVEFHIPPDASTGRLYWRVTGNECCNPYIKFWQEDNKTIPVPIGEWFTAETYYKMGDNNTGRVVFAIQRDGGPLQVVFDVTDWTYHPDHEPEGAYRWHPHKLYADPVNVDIVRNSGGVMQIYWDDWELWTGLPPATTEPLLQSITVSPPSASVTPGGAVQFQAAGSDQYGNPFPVAPTWSASGGSIDQNGLFTDTSPEGGQFSVTAASGEVSGSAVVQVQSAADLPSIPGRLEVEDYNQGGEGVAYHDTSSGNNGGQYRSDDVDLQATSDLGGGYNVGWVSDGEWLAYDVNITQAGLYQVTARVATNLSGAKSLHLEVDGVDVTGPMSFSGATGWQDWRDVSVSDVSLSAGVHRLKVFLDADSFNLNYLDFVPLAEPDNQPPEVYAGHDQQVTMSSPAVAELDGSAQDDGQPDGNLFYQWSASGPAPVVFGDADAASTTATFDTAGDYQLTLAVSDGELAGSDSLMVSVVPEPDQDRPPSIPGRIQAEDYNEGGEGVAYHDTTSGNAGGQYRQDDVDIQATEDAGGGYNVGWVQDGEWLAYAVEVAQSGVYDITARVATNKSGAKSLHLELDGVDVTGPLSFSGATGWQDWRDVTVTGVTLAGGPHQLRVVMDADSFNVNYLDFALQGPPENQAPQADAGTNQARTDADGDGFEELTLDGSASSDADGAIVSHQWTEGGQPVATGVSPTVSLALGVHQLTLTVTDDEGATDTDTVTVTVSVLYGDVDENGEFNPDDVHRFMDWLIGLAPLPASGSRAFLAGDVNGDGTLDMADVALLIQKLSGAVSKFPVEQ